MIKIKPWLKRITAFLRLGEKPITSTIMIKTPVSIFKSIALKSLAFGGLALLATSCLDDIDIPDPTPAAYVSIYQGSATAPDLNIFADNNQVTQQPLGFSEFIAYSPFFIGERLMRYTSASSTSSLLEQNVTLEVDKVYSIFLSSKDDQLESTLVEDIWEDPVADLAQLRFAHLSSELGEVYVEFSGLTTPITPNVKFQDITDFAELEPGIYDIDVKSVENGESLLQIDGVEIKERFVYTLILKGNEGATETSKELDLQLITNYFGI